MIKDCSGYPIYTWTRSLATGAVLWGPVSLGGTYHFGALAYDGGQVFAVNYDGQLSAFDAATGTRNWIVQLPNQWSFTSPPVASDGTVYLSGAGLGGTLYAVAESDGSLQWSMPVANGDDNSPAVDANGVYVSYACEQAYGFGLDGSALWHHSTGCEGGGARTAVLRDGKGYVRDNSAAAPVVLSQTTGALVDGFASDTPPRSTAIRLSQLTAAC